MEASATTEMKSGAAGKRRPGDPGAEVERVQFQGVHRGSPLKPRKKEDIMIL